MADPDAENGVAYSRPDRTFFCAFFAILTVAIALIAVLRLAPLPVALFSEQDRLSVLDRLPADEVAAAKVRYALSQPRFDIGLFGNSRILMVGERELAGADLRIFNFAIGGQSLRQSILLLDHLDRHDKLPRRIVISVDHVELGMPGLDGVFPPAPERWRLRAVEAGWILQHRGWRTMAVHLINSAAIEAEQFKLAFSHSYISSKSLALAGRRDGKLTYRSDGSRQESFASDTPDLRPAPRRADTYPLLEYDMSVLERLKAKDIDITLYESPLSPAIAASTESSLSERAGQVRTRLHAECSRIGLRCLPPPIFDGTPWPDRDHAPAAQLAPWLSATVLNPGTI
jgi:hypothetical protein